MRTTKTRNALAALGWADPHSGGPLCYTTSDIAPNVATGLVPGTRFVSVAHKGNAVN